MITWVGQWIIRFLELPWHKQALILVMWVTLFVLIALVSFNEKVDYEKPNPTPTPTNDQSLK